MNLHLEPELLRLGLSHACLTELHKGRPPLTGLFLGIGQALNCIELQMLVIRIGPFTLLSRAPCSCRERQALCGKHVAAWRCRPRKTATLGASGGM